MKLTVKQEKFCHKYLECGNASEAYRHAYACKKMTPNAIRVEACRLLSDPNVSLMIDKLRGKLEKTAELEMSDVVNMLSDVIMSDVTEYVAPNGVVRVSDIRKMPIDKRRLIESIKAKRDGVEITLVSKMSAIDRLCKIMGWDAPSDINMNIAKPMTKDEAKKIIEEL